MQIIKEKTQSYCDICYSEVPAMTFVEKGSVFLRKTCKDHGEFTHLIETDPDFYRMFASAPSKEPPSFGTLVIPVTHRCNLNCKYCYAPATSRTDMPLNEIQEAASAFGGQDIAISGGEPTLRDDLEKIISTVRESGKGAILLTNGLRLSDLKYLKRLIKAGLNRIFFSLDSFSPGFYDEFKGSKENSKDLLEIKKRALDNIENERVPTLLNATIYPGVNDKEISDLFIFSLQKSRFVEMLRLRSCVAIGRNSGGNKEGYFASELFSLFADAVKIDKKTLLAKHLVLWGQNTPYHVMFSMTGSVRDGRFIPQSDAQSAKNLLVRIIHWPNVKSIDLLDADRGIGHIAKGNRVINFCRAIILDNKN